MYASVLNASFRRFRIVFKELSCGLMTTSRKRRLGEWCRRIKKIVRVNVWRISTAHRNSSHTLFVLCKLREVN